MPTRPESFPNQAALHLPHWLRKTGHDFTSDHDLRSLMRTRMLHTVCEEARCPNRKECFSSGTATFLILGDVCTRRCGFCAILPGVGPSLETLQDEPGNVAEAAAELKLRYVVITSVTRDDLPDGGAGHFARTIKAVRKRLPEAGVEVLTPDFEGNQVSLRIVLEAEPDTFNHNIETVPRLYPSVRPQAQFARSLNVLIFARSFSEGLAIKSGLMVGIGESPEEVREVLCDLHRCGVDVVTIGQYLRPSREHLPVAEYVHPDLFEEYREFGEKLGFKAVFAGPFVRSSYMAEDLYLRVRE